MKNVMTILIVGVFCGMGGLVQAALFEEHVTDGTLDENWTDIVRASASWDISNEQSHSPNYSRKGTNGGSYYQGSSYATDLVLPDNYSYSAWVYNLDYNGNGKERSGLWFNVVDTENLTYDGYDEYELLLWEGDLLLGKRIHGAWNGLSSVSGISSLGKWSELKVEVNYNGSITNIKAYVDGSLKISYTDSTNPYHGGTIGIHRNNYYEAYFDDIVVTPEPATIGLLALGVMGLLRKR